MGDTYQMRRRTKTFICIFLTLVLLGGCKKTIFPDEQVSKVIVDQLQKDPISFDDIGFPWDYVVIDSCYGIQDALKELGVKERGSLLNSNNDETYIVFVQDDEVVHYCILSSADKGIDKLAKSYLYQGTKQKYPRGYVFRFDSGPEN